LKALYNAFLKTFEHVLLNGWATWNINILIFYLQAFWCDLIDKYIVLWNNVMWVLSPSIHKFYHKLKLRTKPFDSYLR